MKIFVENEKKVNEPNTRETATGFVIGSQN